MANLQDIRRRIKSVKSMQQLTRAMKLVSAARLRRAQERVVAARPYAQTMARVFDRLAARAGDYKDALLNPRGDEHYLLILITGDRGLAGAFNSNLIKAAQAFVGQHPGKKIELVTVGRKGRDYFRRRSFPITHEFLNVTSRAFDHSDGAEIAQAVMQDFVADDSTIDRVFLLYSEFKSVMAQKPVVKQLLPVGTGITDEAEAEKQSEQNQMGEALIDYLYEQPPAQIFGSLLPRYVETQVFQAMLESAASEHGSRMTAMDSASKNAGDVIDTLTLNMNRVRQASITREIIEVVSGAEAQGQG